ncbi:DoxX family protein [Brumimicrobium mesophilum]|uniref:DoxX family protein n=1 Tax=Brumimicrobium mesophilum TaxID=392717 RepID=UPI000D140E84|nr:DoxX family membrane protein [Brumimicrobium mesophilum]
MENFSLYIMASIYIIAGILHFIKPKPYARIIPKYIPYPKMMVYISGFFELIFGIGLLFEITRSYAAIGLILLLIAVFPANIYMAKRMYQKQSKNAWIAYLRLPLQFVLIYWAFLYI